MKASTDKVYERTKDYDFADAKPVAETPHLARLQAVGAGRSRITIRVDREVLAVFKARAQATGGSYQTLMNEALRQFAQGATLGELLRDTVREAVRGCLSEGGGAKGTISVDPVPRGDKP